MTDLTSSLAPTGRLRAAINLGNIVLAQRDAATGRLGGVSVGLALELGRRLGIPVDLSVYDAAGKVFDAADTGAWDIAFAAIDPARAEKVDFTAPYVFIEGTYLVRADSELRRLDQFDRPGVRIAVGRGAAYDLFLSRALSQAELVRAPTSVDAIALFQKDGLEAVAGVRQSLVEAARGRPDLRVLDGSFTRIEQAMAIPRGRPAATAYVAAFVEEMKASGFVRRALDASGQDGAVVAPPAAP